MPHFFTDAVFIGLSGLCSVSCPDLCFGLFLLRVSLCYCCQSLELFASNAQFLLMPYISEFCSVYLLTFFSLNHSRYNSQQLTFIEENWVPSVYFPLKFGPHSYFKQIPVFLILQIKTKLGDIKRLAGPCSSYLTELIVSPGVFRVQSRWATIQLHPRTISRPVGLNPGCSPELCQTHLKSFQEAPMPGLHPILIKSDLRWNVRVEETSGHSFFPLYLHIWTLYQQVS